MSGNLVDSWMKIASKKFVTNGSMVLPYIKFKVPHTPSLKIAKESKRLLGQYLLRHFSFAFPPLWFSPFLEGSTLKMDPKFEQQRERSSRAFYLHKREGFLSACCNCHHHQKLFWPFSLAAAALLSPFSMHEINSLFYTLSLLCIAASERENQSISSEENETFFLSKLFVFYSVGLIFSRFYKERENQTHLHFFF